MASNYDPKLRTFSIIYTFTTIFFIFLTKSQSSASPSIYDLLIANALPAGIFPKGISNFFYDHASRRFELRRSRSCAARFESDVWYNVTVAGTLSFGMISHLSGVAAQDLFLWLPVNEIRVDIPSSGLIYFDAAVVSKQFSLSFFEIPPDCRALDIEKLVSSSLSLLPRLPQGNLILFGDRGRKIEGQSRKLMMQSSGTGRAVS
ncbi:PREDICTED: uncharacterized protein LOC109180544 isoform X2 [Ipomoea nil]|uniref:uncharacterized protein LOC109180544 isoform X2 n=1 Tax=Ipomoea nil TaxID=35883 RepID=UPI0009018313|nr:PREDICTED: uncharacterized protein LOC109180544 isoform X2 [Ipomoea nil]